MQAPVIMLCSESCGIPPKMFVILHPIAVTAPNPIKIPPKNCFNNVKASFGTLNLNSPLIRAAMSDPRIAPTIMKPGHASGSFKVSHLLYPSSHQ